MELPSTDPAISLSASSEMCVAALRWLHTTMLIAERSEANNRAVCDLGWRMYIYIYICIYIYIYTSNKNFILKYFRCRDGKRTETRIGMEGARNGPKSDCFMLGNGVQCKKENIEDPEVRRVVVRITNEVAYWLDYMNVDRVELACLKGITDILPFSRVSDFNSIYTPLIIDVTSMLDFQVAKLNMELNQEVSACVFACVCIYVCLCVEASTDPKMKKFIQLSTCTLVNGRPIKQLRLSHSNTAVTLTDSQRVSFMLRQAYIRTPRTHEESKNVWLYTTNIHSDQSITKGSY